MKKLILTVLLTYVAMMSSAFAQTQDKHALGNMYTKALNMAEAAGMLNTLVPERRVEIINMHMDHGQVFMTLSGGNGPPLIAYDPIANKLVYSNDGQPSVP